MAHILNHQNLHKGGILASSNNKRSVTKTQKAAISKTDALLDHQVTLLFKIP